MRLRILAEWMTSSFEIHWMLVFQNSWNFLSVKGFCLIFFMKKGWHFFLQKGLTLIWDKIPPIIFFIPYEYQGIEVFGGKLTHLKMCAAVVQETGVWSRMCVTRMHLWPLMKWRFFFFFQMFLLKCLTNTVYWLWKPSVLTVLGILGKGWEYWFISGQRATFDFNGTFAWIVCF